MTLMNVVGTASSACSDSSVTAWSEDSVPSCTVTFRQKRYATMKVVCSTFVGHC